MNYRKGAITLYFSIIFLSVVLVTVTTIDSARMAYSYASAHRAVNIAAQNVLSQYDYELKEEFGMFGYHKGSIQNDVEFYIKNSSPFKPKEGSVKVSAHDYDHVHSKEQVLEYMKYRAPVRLVLEGAHKMFGIFDRLKDDAQNMELVGKNAQAQSKALEFYEYLNKEIRGRLIGIVQNDATHSFDSYKDNIRALVQKEKDERKFAYGNELDSKIPEGKVISDIKDDLGNLYSASGSGDTVVGSFKEIKGLHKEIQENQDKIPKAIQTVNKMFDSTHEKWEEENKDVPDAEENPYDKKWKIDESNFVLKKETIDKYEEIEKGEDEERYLEYFSENPETKKEDVEEALRKIIKHYKRVKHFIEACKKYTESLKKQYDFLENLKICNKELQTKIDEAERLKEVAKTDAQKLHDEVAHHYTEGSSVISAQAKNDLENVIRSLESFQIKISGKPINVGKLKEALKNNVNEINRAKKQIKRILLNEDFRAIEKSVDVKFEYYNNSIYADSEVSEIKITDPVPNEIRDFLTGYNCHLFYDFKTEYIKYDVPQSPEEQQAQANITSVVKQAKAQQDKDDQEEQKSAKGKKSVKVDQLHYESPDDDSLFGGLGDIFDVITGFDLSISGAKKFFQAIGKITKFATNFMDELKNFLSNAINNIYINEYILGAFDSEVSLKGDFKSELNLRYETKEESKFLEDNPLDYEVEYVVSGKLSDRENRRGVGNRILAIRMIPNVTYLLIHESPFIAKIAAACSFGIAFLVPIISFVIVIGWAFAESYFDLKRLRMGRRVPFFKTPGNFLLSKEGMKEIVKIFSDEAKEKLTDFVEESVDKISNDTKEQINKAAEKINLKLDEVSNDLRESFEKETKNAVDYIYGEYSATKSLAIEYVKDSINKTYGGTNPSIDGNGQKVLEKMRDKLKEKLGEDTLAQLKHLIEEKASNSLDKLDSLVEEKLKAFHEKITNEVNEEIELRTKDLKKHVDGVKDKANENVDQASKVIKDESGKAIESGVDKLSGKWISIFDSSKKELYQSDTDVKTKSNSLSDFFSMSYKDYLRLLLFFTGDDAKNKRVVNLHRMHGLKNKKWDTKELGSYFQVEATYEVKFLFIPTVVSILRGGGLGGSEKTKSIKDIDSNYTFRVQSLMAY